MLEQEADQPYRHDGIQGEGAEQVGGIERARPAGRRDSGIVDETDALPGTLGENGAELPLDRRARRGYLREIEREVPVIGPTKLWASPCDADDLPAPLQQFAGDGGTNAGARAGDQREPLSTH